VLSSAAPMPAMSPFWLITTAAVGVQSEGGLTIILFRSRMPLAASQIAAWG
jgi:hypothetical protein